MPWHFGKDSIMKIFSYSSEKGQTQIGVEYENELYNFSLAWELYKQIKSQGRGPELNFLQLMVEADFLQPETFEEVFTDLKNYRPLDDLKIKKPYGFEPPLGRPQKILCVGRNFRKHAEELGNKIPDEPVFFSKAPSSLTAHDQPIKLPKNIGRVDYEGELAVVIGKTAGNVPAVKAFDIIAGYTILNDVTARDMQTKDKQAGLPWFRSKSFDTFCPCGPYLIPAKAIQDYRTLTLEVRLNGELKQRATLADMIFDIPVIVSYISKFCTLQPGDIIATGTPAGVGELTLGDRVEVSIDKLGTLTNTVV